MSSKRELRSSGSTSAQTLDPSKVYKLNSSGVLVESTGTPGATDIVFTGSKSALRRLNDLERNVSILAAKALTDDGEGTGTTGTVDYAKTTGKWLTARTLSLTGDVTGSVNIDGSGNASMSTTIAANSVVLGTDTTGNYVASLVAGTGITLSNNSGEGATPTVAVDTSTIATQSWVTTQIQTKDNTDEITEGSTNLYFTNARARSALSGSTGISYNSSTGAISCTITQYTDALARGAVSFTAGSGAYNSSTGVFTIPTNTNQLTNGAGFVTSSGVTSIATSNGISGGTITSTGTLSLSGTYSGTWAVSGAITATGEVTAYYSDLRLKKNIVQIADALEKVEAINGVTFDPNEAALALGVDDTHQMGVIAQEIEAVAPELVTESAFKGYKTVKYDKLTALLIEAVKELSAKVKVLEAQVGSKPEL
jgi:hypothetical protein